MQSVTENRKKCTYNPEAYIYKYLVNKTNICCSDASLIVWLLWEGASDPFDDDVGGVVSGPDTLLQLVLLDQRREESWLDRRAKGQTRDHPSPPKICLGSS